MPTSVLVAGCATTAEEHERLLARAATVHKKHGPFCAILCLEAPTAAAQAASAAALPEHALAPADAAGRDGISWLRGSGMTQLDGLVVAYVYAAEPTDDDLAALLSRAAESSFRGVDLLLTRSWPRAVHHELGAVPLPEDGIVHQSDGGSEALAKLAVALRPRYHFCASADGHWQRPPYQLPHGSGLDVCRLIALARVQEDRKTKWLHALSVVSRRVKRPRADFVKDPRGWVSKNCWFCMASPNFEAHMVASVSDEAYVACAKGPLVPQHVLIVPVSHRICSLELSEPEALEVRRYVDALRTCFSSAGKALILFERFVGRTNFEHMHLQALPLDADLAARAREAFERAGSAHGMNFECLPAGVGVRSRLGAVEPFFAVELPSGETLLHRLATNPRRHPLQFGREVLANLLGNARRVDWKECVPRPAPGASATVAVLEQQVRDDFAHAFAPFDPTAAQG